MTLEEFVLEHLPPPSARVLEVGCGGGALAMELVAAGHAVVAIDPEVPGGATFRRTTLEHFADPGPFDAVVASRSLHHIPQLDDALDKVRRLLVPEGRVIVNEHAFERLDEPTAAWYWDRLRSVERSGEGPAVPDTPAECRSEWERAHAELHHGRTMLAALDRRFECRLLAWEPYLYEELAGAATAAEERALIERGLIQPTGFRYVGRRSATLP